MGAYEDALARGKVKGRVGQTEQIKQAVGKLAPLASIYTTATNEGVEQTPTVKVSRDPKGNILEESMKWVGNVGAQGLGLAGEGIKYLADSAVKTAQNVGTFIAAPIDLAMANAKTDQIQANLKNIEDKRSALMNSYQQGTISKDEYKKSLIDLSNENLAIGKESDTNIQDIERHNVENTVEQAVDTVLTVAAIASAGATRGLSTVAIEATDSAAAQSAKQLVKFFGKDLAVSSKLYSGATKIDNIVKTVAKNVNKVSTAGGRLPAGQLIRLTESTLANAAEGATAKQLAKQVAINVLLKKPIIYQTDVDVASDIYKDMLKGDLSGAALSTVATGAMALSGGPIGLAFDLVGKGFRNLKNYSMVGDDIGEILAREAKANKLSGKANYISQKWIEEQAGKKVNTNSFIDVLSTKIGKGESSQMYEAMLKRLNNGEEHVGDMMRVMEDINVKMAKGNVSDAAKLVSDYYEQTFGPAYLRTHTADEVIDDMVKHATNRDMVVQDAIKNGLTRQQASRIVVGRVTKSDLSNINKALVEAEKIVGKQAGDKLSKTEAKMVVEARRAIVDKMVDQSRLAPWANSKSFIAQLDDAISTSNYEEMAKKINSITPSSMYKSMDGKGKISKKVRDALAKDGYIATMPEKTFTPYVTKEEVAGKKLLTTATEETDDIFQAAVKPLPVLQHIAKGFAKLGLSPQESQAKVYQAFEDNFNQIISEADNIKIKVGNKVLDGEHIMAKLNNHIRSINDLPVSRKIIDPRQLTVKETMTALDCSREQAKAVLGALNTSMLSVPIALRGLGDKILDVNAKLTGGLSQQYARTQGAGRYTYNPFFKLQQSTQTEAFVQAEIAAQKLGRKPVQSLGLTNVNRFVFPEFAQTNEKVVDFMKKKNIFAQGFSGEMTGDAFARVGSSITESEKRSLAGLVQLQAKKFGYVDAKGAIDYERYINDNFENVVDTMGALVLQGKKKGITDSPLAKTINLAFFPFRYNMKTSKLIADYVGKLDAPTQVALLANYYKADDWLKSDEGINWQSQYAEAIKLFKWISPTYPLDYVLKLGKNVVDPDNASMGDLGMLGGVPFGFISQMLEANGVIAASAPYVNPKSGEVYPKYVPENAKAQVALAIQTFLGSMFSYPGSIVGLPSKGSLLRGFTNATVGGSYDTTAVSQESRLTPDQRQQVEVLQRNQPQQTNQTSEAQQNVTSVINRQ